jgi:lysophospholipase L1-like esterase
MAVGAWRPHEWAMEALPYVAMGDSAGVGVGSRDGRGYVDRVYDRLEAVAPRARLVNLCLSGATSETVREKQLAQAVAARPAIVTLFIGANDLWRGVTTRRYGGYRRPQALRAGWRAGGTWGSPRMFCPKRS